MKELTKKQPKWRWTLLPLTPLAIAVGLIVGIVTGLMKQQAPPLLIECKRQNRRSLPKAKKGD